MTLYSKYGMIQGTVDEILEFIQKETPNSITSGSNYNYNTEPIFKIFNHIISRENYEKHYDFYNKFSFTHDTTTDYYTLDLTYEQQTKVNEYERKNGIINDK